MNSNHKIITIFLAVLFLVTSIAQSYCPPYRAKIDSIKNAKDCLSIEASDGCGYGRVKVINNCSGEFYLYNKDGTLDENIIIINIEKKIENSEGYRRLEKETGKKYWGQHNIDVGVKYWKVKIFSKEDNQDIIVKGRTLHVESPDDNFNPIIFLCISIISFIVSVVLLFRKYRLKKKVNIVIPIMLIVFGFYFCYLYIVDMYLIK